MPVVQRQDSLRDGVAVALLRDGVVAALENVCEHTGIEQTHYLLLLELQGKRYFSYRDRAIVVYSYLHLA